jgi:hypothetical protein
MLFYWLRYIQDTERSPRDLSQGMEGQENSEIPAVMTSQNTSFSKASK